MIAYAGLEPDAIDTAIPDVTAAIADMIGQVLAPYGVAQSVVGPVPQIDVSPESGTFVEHIAFSGHADEASECTDDVIGMLRSRYYLAPAQADMTTAVNKAESLIIPAIRAHRKHIEHTVGGQQIACRFTEWDVSIHTRGTGENARDYYTLVTTCILSLEVMEPYESG